MDCESGICKNGSCAVARCGDGVKNGDEDCDSKGKTTASCNADCTMPICGDGHVDDKAGELCEPDENAEVWARCNTICTYGVRLDGTWSTEDVGMGGGPSTPWETLAINEEASDNLAGLQSFHYSGQDFIYDLTTNTRYDIAADSWSALEAALPYSPDYWENGAVDSMSIWVPRGGSMYRFVLATETWETPSTEVPDGANEDTAAVFDANGFIWYAGGDDELVKYDPKDGTFDTFSFAADFPAFDVYEARVAYDPLSNKLVVTGYENDSFLVFDLTSEEFSQGSVSPGGPVRDNSCQDLAGGIYVGSDDDPGKMYRYDIAADEFTVLPDLPVQHDNNSTCVVSEDGYLYYATNTDIDGQFFRLKLNKR